MSRSITKSGFSSFCKRLAKKIRNTISVQNKHLRLKKQVDKKNKMRITYQIRLYNSRFSIFCKEIIGFINIYFSFDAQHKRYTILRVYTVMVGDSAYSAIDLKKYHAVAGVYKPYISSFLHKFNIDKIPARLSHIHWLRKHDAELTHKFKIEKKEHESSHKPRLAKH